MQESCFVNHHIHCGVTRGTSYTTGKENGYENYSHLSYCMVPPMGSCAVQLRGSGQLRLKAWPRKAFHPLISSLTIGWLLDTEITAYQVRKRREDGSKMVGIVLSTIMSIE